VFLRVALSKQMKTNQVLFICTGNYYRSRFAEELFNHHTERLGLTWRATSRGFRPDPEQNPGSISPHALRGLANLDIHPRDASRMPESLVDEDFDQYPRIIAMSESEHRPMLRERFPIRESFVEFWTAEDLRFESPTEALPKIITNLDRLIIELASV